MRKFAGIYELVLVFSGPYSELHAEGAILKMLPLIERLVAADLRAARRILAWVERWWQHPHVARVRTVLHEKTRNPEGRSKA